ncbi:MAG: hypothetical protein SVX43_17855 [Cyanobacteriota bacterium]|nr:hypothetical protein [Cyanobacteriota bacterium]
MSARYSEVPYRAAEMSEKVPTSRLTDCRIALLANGSCSSLETAKTALPQKPRRPSTSIPDYRFPITVSGR